MKVEILTLLSFVACGFTILNYLGMRKWVVWPLSYISGIAIFSSLGYLQAILGVSTQPLITLALLSVVTFVFSLKLALKGELVALFSPRNLLVGILLVLTIAGIRETRLVRFHTDSVRYLMTASLIQKNELDVMSENLLLKRFSSITVVYAPSGLSGEYYLQSFIPLLAISTLFILFWFIQSTLEIKQYSRAWLVALLGAMLLLTSRSFVWHGFYINGHLLMGAFALVAAGCAYQMGARQNKGDDQYLVFLLCMGVVGALLTRPEAAIYVAIVLAPFCLSASIKPVYRKLALYSFAGGLLLQQGLILKGTLNVVGVPSVTKLLILVGLAAFVAPKMLQNKFVVDYRKKLLLLVEISPWALLALFVAKSPDIFINSVSATYQNLVLGKGGWGLSLIVLFVFAGYATFFTSFSKDFFLRLPVTTFLPLSFILAYVREGMYRVGVTDSLNRMFMQIVPIIILYVVVAFVTKSEKAQGLKSTQ